VPLSRLVPLVSLASLAGCEPIVLGDLPNAAAAGAPESPVQPSAPEAALVWSTDHESGDASSWSEDGAAEGGQYTWGTGTIAGTSALSRSGSYALELFIDNNGVGPSDGARLYRGIEQVPARYGVWFYLPQAHAVGEWWAPAIFNARDVSLSQESTVQLWDIRITGNGGGNMTLQFFDHATMQATPIPGGVVPTELWFHIEVYLDFRPPDATTLRVRLNGALVFQTSGLQTNLEEHVLWVVGNAAAGLEPSASSLYLDDATVTTGEGP
jgi:hypothetical protein